MKKIFLYKGLPGSGKTTHAFHVMDNGPNRYKRVNKDDLRAMLDNGVWSRDSEKLILFVRDAIIGTALAKGKHVIVDDTNLHPKHEAKMRQLAKEFGAKVEVVDFTDVPIEECIEHDLDRNRSVGEKVIRRMHKQFLAEKPTDLKQDDKLPRAIICDIDGTIAHANDRSPYDWDKVGEDTIDSAVSMLLGIYEKEEFVIILLSGRDSCCRSETRTWLEDNCIQYDSLYMRAEGDNRKDCTIKKELYDKHVKDKYYVELVLDDRNQMVDMWRSLGLKCFQVAEGNF